MSKAANSQVVGQKEIRYVPVPIQKAFSGKQKWWRGSTEEGEPETESLGLAARRSGSSLDWNVNECKVALGVLLSIM